MLSLLGLVVSLPCRIADICGQYDGLSGSGGAVRKFVTSCAGNGDRGGSMEQEI